MLRLFLILSLTGIGSTAPLFGQEQLFPICENGRWGMVRENGALVLEPLYDYIGYDKKGKKFIYYQSKKMGLIDQDGKVYSDPIYDNIFFPDTSWVSYQLGEKWNLFFETTEIFPAAYDSVITVQKNILGLVQGDSMQFFNMISKSKTAEWYTSGFTQGNYFFAFLNNDYDLCALNNMQVISEQIKSVNYAEDTLNIITYADGQIIFNNITGQFLGEKFETISYSRGNFVGSKNGSGQLYVPVEKKSYTIPEADAIISTNFPYLTFAKGDGVGVWNLASGKLIIPPIYDAVSRVSGAFFTRLDGYYGIVGSDGTEILDPEFSAISTYDNLYLVEQDGLSGLYTKRGKEITDCIYNEIRVYDKNVKCFRGKELDMLSIDENGAIASKMTYTNYMSISFEQAKLPAQRSTSVNFSSSNSNDSDPLLNERYGWFQEVVERQMADTVKKVKGKWGLIFEGDSIAIKPKFGDVRVIVGTQYSAAYTLKMFNLSKTEGMRRALSNRAYFQMGQVGTGFSRGYFRLVNHETKQQLSKTSFQYIDYKNFENYKLARAVTSVPVLINANGDVIYDNLTYVGNWDEDLLIICEGGTYGSSGSPGQTSPTTIENFLTSIGLAADSINYNQPWLMINGGKWSIIDKNGRRINQEPYQYISPFNTNRSLVQKNNKWGVIDSTLKEIVPITYQSVSEIYVKGERFFQVNNPVNNTFIYTRSTGSLIKTEIDAVKHYCNGRWFAHHINTNKWALTDTALAPITGYDFDQVTAFYDGYAMVTKRGKRSVIDLNGNEYLEGYKAKEINYLGYDRFEIIQGNGSFVTSLSGDTLVEPGTCKEVVHSTEEFLIYLDKNKSYFPEKENSGQQPHCILLS